MINWLCKMTRMNSGSFCGDLIVVRHEILDIGVGLVVRFDRANGGEVFLDERWRLRW